MDDWQQWCVAEVLAQSDAERALRVRYLDRPQPKWDDTIPWADHRRLAAAGSYTAANDAGLVLQWSWGGYAAA